MNPETCPNCGAEVPPRAKACPECGSCAETGWSDSAAADALGLPDENFNYDEFVEREFGEKEPARGGLPRWVWATTAAVVLAILVWSMF